MFFKHIFKLNQSQVNKLKQAIGKYRDKLNEFEELNKLETWNYDFEDVMFDITEEFLSACGQDEADFLYAYKHRGDEDGIFFYTYEDNLKNLIMNTPEIQDDIKPYYEMDSTLIPSLLDNEMIIRIDGPQAKGSLHVVFGIEEQIFHLVKPSRH